MHQFMTDYYKKIPTPLRESGLMFIGKGVRPTL